MVIASATLSLAKDVNEGLEPEDDKAEHENRVISDRAPEHCRKSRIDDETLWCLHFPLFSN